MRLLISVLVAMLVLATGSLVTGCGPSSVIVTPDYGHPDLQAFHLKRDSVRIVSVIDGRPVRSSRIGTARVGVLNREVPYLLNGEVADVVRTILDTLIVARHDQDRYVPVSVSVDMLEVGEHARFFSEEGYFACNLRFSFPMTPDSQGHQIVFVKQTDGSSIDVTDAIEPLMYKGIAECARSFVQETLDRNQHIMKVLADSVEVFRAQDSLRVAHQTIRNTESEQVAGAQRTKNGMTFQYTHGNSIRYGIRASYIMLTGGQDSESPSGLGIGMTFYDIVNSKDGLNGNFISFDAKWITKMYLSSDPSTAYISGSIGLVGGTERVNYGNREEVTFFSGPTIQEVVGVSIDRKVSFEFGAFQLVHIGSRLLPSDVGLVAGLCIGF